MRDRPALLGYFEQWCTRQIEILLEESPLVAGSGNGFAENTRRAPP
jgi:hypothetical protein